MANPSSFVSFADYLGLNNEAGKQMLDRSVDGAEKELTDNLEKTGEEQRTIARTEGSDADFKAAGDKMRAGLASYGDFLKGMNDPAERRALMEKVYGKGGVSWLDSALAGGTGGNRLAQERTEADQRQKLMEGNEGRYRERLVGDRAATEARRDAIRMENARKQEYQERMEKKRLEDEENYRVDEYGKATADKEGGPYEAGGKTWTGQVDWGGIFGMPNKNINTGNISQREWARQSLARYERETGNKYKPGGKI